MINFRFLLIPLASRVITVFADDDEAPSTTFGAHTVYTRVREVYVFGIRIIRWGIL